MPNRIPLIAVPIASLREYVLIAQDKRQVDIYRRADDGNWRLQTLVAGDVLQLETLGASLSLGEVYEDVEFMENQAVAPVDTV